MAEKQMELMTEKQADEVFGIAKDWIENTNAKVVFANSKYIACTAVAEYIANQRGLTLYKGSVP